MRDVTIKLRALPEQRDLINRAAALIGKSRSDFMLETAFERAQAVILDQVLFGPDEEKFRQLTALLEEPPVPNSGLELLMSVKAPWVRTKA